MPTPRWMSQSTSEEFSWSQTLGGTRGIIEASARHDAEVAAQDAAARPAGPPGRSGRNSQYRRGSSNRPARPYSERNPHDH